MKRFQQVILQNIKNIEPESNEEKIKSQIDSILEEISNLTIQHYILDHIDADDFGKKRIKYVGQNEFHFMFSKLKERLSKIDHVDFLTNNLMVKLTKHFESQRIFLSSEDENAEFETYEHLRDAESEKEYLRCLSGVLIRHLLPPAYSELRLLHLLTQDVLTNLVLGPAIDTLADPDFINTRYIYYVTKWGHREKIVKESPNETSPSSWSSGGGNSEQSLNIGEELCFENILLLINLSNTATDEETLKQVLKLLTQNIEVIVSLRDFGDECLDPEFQHWTDIMAELTLAKTCCQLKLEELVCSGAAGPGPAPLAAVLGSTRRRQYFSSFLAAAEDDLPVLEVWEAAEELRRAGRARHHELGTRIFYSYLRRPVPALALDRALLRRVERFLVGDSGHQVCTVLYYTVVYCRCGSTRPVCGCWQRGTPTPASQ